MGKYKVLMVGPDRSVHGGISGVVNNYYAAGLDQKIELKYIGTMIEGSKVRKLWRAMKAYMQFLVQLSGYDIVHVNMASDASYVRKSFFIKAAKRAGKKIVIHQHGGDFEGYYGQLSQKGKKRVKEILSMGDIMLVLAPSWKKFFGTLIDENKIIVFPDCIEMPPVYQKQYGQHKLLFLGRICKEKGVLELLAAAEKLQQKYPGAKLYLGGIFEDEKLKEQIEKNSDFVKYLGWISGKEKQKYLQESDIFVLPSYFEGQSIAILEAMANYCAIAASDTGGIPQMIQQEETGLLFEPRDEKSLYAALDRLLADKHLCKKLGNSAREKAEKEFSIEKNMEELLKIYGSI